MGNITLKPLKLESKTITIYLPKEIWGIILSFLLADENFSFLQDLFPLSVPLAVREVLGPFYRSKKDIFTLPHLLSDSLSEDGDVEKMYNCAAQGYLPIVQYFHDLGTPLRAYNDAALCLAAREGHLPVVKYLLEHNGDLHVDGDYPLCKASEFGRFDVVKLLVEKKANIYANQNSPLLNALRERQHKVANYLISQGAFREWPDEWIGKPIFH